MFLNSYFILSNHSNIKIKKFHMSTLELKSDLALVEIGGEIDHECVEGLSKISLSIFIPWLTEQCTVRDLYNSLKESVNSKFIFNEHIVETSYLMGGDNRNGAIHTFAGGRKLGLLPLDIGRNNGLLQVSIDFKDYPKIGDRPKNPYFRFVVETSTGQTSEKRNGIARSTILFDSKINEARNLPEQLRKADFNLCHIESCYSFNIIPDSFVNVLEDRSLKSIRRLETQSFKSYLNDERINQSNLLVVFQKKEAAESYSFFSIYHDEEIGAPQIFIAVLINLLTGILLFFPSYRMGLSANTSVWSIIVNAPIELYLAVGILFLTITYFWKQVKNSFKTILNRRR